MGALGDIVSDYFNETYGEAYTTAAIMDTIDSNNQWLLKSGYMVFLMQAGFAMLCAGSVRAKNAKNIILLNILDACLGSLCWYATGYAFAYGDPPDGPPEGGYTTTQQFIGNRYFFLINADATSDYASWFFQFTFAATCATIVSGAVAERCRIWAYLSYEFILVCFVYPVVAHWVWSLSGWASHFNNDTRLFGVGVCDFSGDGPVHMVGGVASLAAAWILGPRIGRFNEYGIPVDMPGHNASLTLLGIFFLWFGWFGFNTGSTRALAGYSILASRVAINTTLGAATGALATLVITMGITKLATGRTVVDLIMVGNGALAGLVSVTGPCGYIEIWASIPIGIIGAFVYVGCSNFVLNVLKVDDPLDAIAVHAGAGMWGLIATGAFATKPLVQAGDNYGFIMGGNGNLLGCQLVIILAICAWVMGIMVPFFFLLRSIGLFRIPPDVESVGLDFSYHGGSAYHQDVVEDRLTVTSELLLDRKIQNAIACAVGAAPGDNPKLNNL